MGGRGDGSGEDSVMKRVAYRALVGKPEGKMKEASWKVQVWMGGGLV